MGLLGISLLENVKRVFLKPPVRAEVSKHKQAKLLIQRGPFNPSIPQGEREYGFEKYQEDKL